MPVFHQLFLSIKLQGSGVLQSTVLRGMVFKREAFGDVSKVQDAKIVVYSCALDLMQTETKVWSTSRCWVSSKLCWFRALC
jgi:chaperonin GroEL (HSP60 family)